ncbi:MAG: TraR/DksA C4-type zinc finger protein [Patescibacteria group bacterium]
MALNEKQIIDFKNQLLKEKEGLEKKIGIVKKVADFGDDIDAFDEETDEAEEFSNQLGLKKSFEENLENINLALEKIAENKYGLCEECGEEIELAVLHAEPQSKLCKAHKK